MKNILVIRGGAIGDFILTMPVLSALRARYPAAQLELLANPSIASLATNFDLADNIRDLGSQPFAPLFSLEGKCSPAIAEWLSHFDLIICYLYDPAKIFETNIRRHSTAQYITGPHRPNEQSTAHASLQLLEPVGVLSSKAFDVGRWTLNVGRSPSNKIAIHPGSGSPQKNWPEQNWRSLLQHLVSTSDDNILLIGGEAERDRLPQLAELVPLSRRDVALELPLVELADRLKHCRVFIGHDSGITHLAALLGLDCIVLWGPSNDRVWRPVGDRVQVLRHPQNLSELPVKAVAQALNSLLTTA